MKHLLSYVVLPFAILLSYYILITINEQVHSAYYYIFPLLWISLTYYGIKKGFGNLSLLGYLVFLLFIYAEILNFKSISFHTLIVYGLFSFALIAIFHLLFHLLNRYNISKIGPYICAILLISFCLIPLSFIVYSLNFGSGVNKEILYAVFQTNSGEAYEYLYDFISYKWIILSCAFLALCIFLLFQQAKSKRSEVGVLFFILFFSFTSYIIMEFPQLKLPSLILEAHAEYNEELEKYIEISKQRLTGDIEYDATKTEKGETYIVVIGESLNKKHMGIYGYFRDTTPHLSKMKMENDLLIYNNAYSSHTHTGPVLKRSLTESNLYNGKDLSKSLSILEILNKSGVKTYWITNQVLYSAYDNPVTVLSAAADKTIAHNRSVGITGQPQKYDSILIDEIKHILAEETEDNRVLFVHLFGNHGSYSLRYPHDTYKKFRGPLNLGDFGKKAYTNKSINHYDNSVLFNDYVVSSILENLMDEKGANGFVYMADHADDVIAKKGHSIGQFTYNMTEIPLLFWFSDEYRKRYPDQYANVINNKDSLYSNDLLYDTLIGIFSIDTNNYQEIHDLSSDKYALDPQDALIIVGDQKYIDPDNHIWWIKSNIKVLEDSNQLSRIYPHRVNSVGKLTDIWNNGFRSFEVDVLYDDTSNQFTVGHNEGVMGHSLEHFLTTIETNDLNRIWLDFKNLSSNNHESALEHLNWLNEKYDVKNKIILETNVTEPYVNKLSQSGWHTSYYLPTDRIIKLIEDQNETEMVKLASEIAEQSRFQELSAVSFDTRLRPFVKKFLEPVIDENINYHCWLGPPLHSHLFHEKLKEDDSYGDERVKTLLVHYKSQFNL